MKEKWIPFPSIKFDAPETGQEVLVYYDDYYLANFDGGCKFVLEDGEIIGELNWMPLPKPSED